MRDPVLYFLQRLRDEAHRFAIGSHRARRKKEMVKNPLDEIDGIGPGRKRALLMHFGTAKAVSRAAMEDLMAVDGISEVDRPAGLQSLPRARLSRESAISRRQKDAVDVFAWSTPDGRLTAGRRF